MKIVESAGWACLIHRLALPVSVTQKRVEHLTLLSLYLTICLASPRAAFEIAVRKGMHVALLLAPRQYAPWNLAHTGRYSSSSTAASRLLALQRAGLLLQKS